MIYLYTNRSNPIFHRFICHIFNLNYMKKKHIVLISLLLFSLFGLAQTDRSLKRKVAIARFSNETKYAKSVFYDKDNDPMGKQAADILSTRLSSTDKFIMIERQDFDQIVKELNKGDVKANTIGADFLIIGSITEYGRKTVGNQKMFSQSKEQIVEAAVSIRLVDVSTGMIIYSGEAKGEATAENKTIMGLGKEANFDATLSDKAISAAISKLVENIINKCMDKPWKAYLLSVTDGTYIMSGGASQGIQAGDSFTIIQKGKSVKNPQNGLMIELPGKEVAHITISQVMGDTPESEVSLATLTDGTIDASALDQYYIIEKK